MLNQAIVVEGQLFRTERPCDRGAFPRPGRTGTPGSPFPITPNTSPFSGSATLTDAQAADLLAGRWYINVHTAANPGGEVRGQLAKM